MNRDNVEKSLKRFLKKKVSYSLSLLVTFLISGMVSYGTETIAQIKSERQALSEKVVTERELLEQKILENEEAIKNLNISLKDMVKEADFYSKPYLETGFGFAILGSYKDASNVHKKYVNSVKETQHDITRKEFNEASLNKAGARNLRTLSLSTAPGTKITKDFDYKTGNIVNSFDYTNKNRPTSYLSNGWITADENYSSNSKDYDVKSELFILPVVNAPEVHSPSVPVVSFTPPAEPPVINIDSPEIASINVADVNIPNITVTPPSVTMPTAPASPGEIKVVVNDPNINITINDINVAGPGKLNIPELETPSVNVAVSPVVPPRIVPPEVVVSSPVAPAPPEFKVFSRGRGEWYINHTSNTKIIFTDWNRLRPTWAAGTQTIPWSGSINNRPMFKIGGRILKGADSDKSKNIINARTFPGEIDPITGRDRVVNSYENIKFEKTSEEEYSDVIALSGGRSNNKWAKSYHSNIDDRESPINFGVVDPNKSYSATDDLNSSWIIDSNGKKIIVDQIMSGMDKKNIPDKALVGTLMTKEELIAVNDYKNKRVQTWIMDNDNSNAIENVTINIGGISEATNDGGTTIFGQQSKITLRDSIVNLYGHAQVAGIATWDPPSIDLTGTEVNFKGDNNTVFGFAPVVLYDGNGTSWMYFPSCDDLAKTAADSAGDYKYKLTEATTINLGSKDFTIGTKRNMIANVNTYSSGIFSGGLYASGDYMTVTKKNLSDADGNPVLDKEGKQVVEREMIPGRKFYYANPGRYRVMYALPYNYKIEHTGKINFTGTSNIAIGVGGFVPNPLNIPSNDLTKAMAPEISLGEMDFSGDSNVGIYLKSSWLASQNGIFNGSVGAKITMGSTLKGQNENGNIGQADKVEKNVGILVESGQSENLNKKVTDNGLTYYQYYPMTLAFNLNHDRQYYTGPVPAKPKNKKPEDNKEIIGLTDENWYQEWQGYVFGSGNYLIGLEQYGNPDVTKNVLYDPIKNLKLTNFDITFGKYSKDSLALVVKNGSAVDIETGGIITDNGDSEATDNTLVYAEGVWYNPRGKITDTRYKDAAGVEHTEKGFNNEAYGRGESTTGQKYISDFNTTINVNSDIKMSSSKAVAAFAKSGAIINTKDITMNGYGSIAAFAHGAHNYSKGTIVDSDNKNADKQPDTKINIAGNVVANNKGSGENLNTNIAVAAVSKDGTEGEGNTTITVTGKVDVAGLGAYAKGKNAKVEIQGAGSTITSGTNGTLVAEEGGHVIFGGGTLNHGVKDKVAFYSGDKSNINFNGATILNISDGVLFYGEGSDFDGGTSSTDAKYSNMGNVTVNLTGHGVNLGVFKEIDDAVWKGNGDTAYVEALKKLPKVSAINTGDYWYKSALEGGQLTIDADVNLDDKSEGANRGDGFNDVTMEREKVILASGKTISSTKGHGLALGSNENAVSNTESGYTIKGNINITGGTDKKQAVAVYTSYGHINNEGNISVDKGVGAYGVNGTKIDNSGNIKITGSGIGALLNATNTETKDNYGKNANKSGTWGELINSGNITVGDGMGIVVQNNENSADGMKVTNTGTITANKGIVITKNDNGKSAELVLDRGTDPRTMDIHTSTNGIGIYAENSKITMNSDYGIEIQDGGVAIQAKGASTIAANDKTLTVEYTGAKDKTAMGMAFDGTASEEFKNTVNIKLVNTGNGAGKGKANTLAGIYGTGAGKIVNSGNIEAIDKGSFGILAKGVDVENTGTINGKAGIYVESAKVTTAGDKIIVSQDGAVGISAKDSEATITAGTNPMEVAGKSGIGLYIENSKINSATDIDLTDSASKDNERRFGIFLTGSKDTANETSGTINVGKNNIGIYNKDSVIKNTGIINVTNQDTGAENIGVHNVTDASDITFANAGTINVDGVKNVGISVKTTDSHKANINLDGGTINVTAKSLADKDIPLGVYAKGNNITVDGGNSSTMTVKPNGVGIYLEGDNTSKTTGNMNINLSSDAGGKLGIGAFYKGGAISDTGDIKLNSTSTALSGINPVRPIGLYFGEKSTTNNANIEIVAASQDMIGMYGTNLALANTGKIDVNAKALGGYFEETNLINTGDISALAASSYGIYLKGGESTTNSNVKVGGENAIGFILTGDSKLENKANGTITSNGKTSIGVYAEKGSEFTNTGIINDSNNTDKSLGILADKSKVINSGTMNSDYLAIYAKNDSEVTTTGDINTNTASGVGIFGDKTVVNLNGGNITGTENDILGVVGTNGSNIKLNGTNLTQTGDKARGMIVEDSKAILTSGDITLGKEGVGIFAKGSNVDLENYSGKITLGKEGVGYYSKDSTQTGGTLNVTYTGTAKSVGVYYNSSNPIENNIVVNHTGDNLVSIVAEGTKVTNNADLKVNEGGIGIFGKQNNSNKGSEIVNKGKLTLEGINSIGMYLDDNGSKITEINEIVGGDNTASNNYKIGIFVKDGDIQTDKDYKFNIGGGIGIYLDSNPISYSGTMDILGASNDKNRTIGIYAGKKVNGNIKTNLNVKGKDAIGIYLANDGTDKANITYDGIMNIDAESDNSTRGIGAVLSENTTFTLGATGEVHIAGKNNIGFHVQEGANLNVTGGKVTNGEGGTFAYLQGGVMNFTAGANLDIDYANIIVAGNTASLTNATTINVGTNGLQGSDNATITNTDTGVINASVEKAKAIVGTSGSTLINAGKIALTGDTSVGIYTENGATATSTGEVSVQDKSVAYYAGSKEVSGTSVAGIINVSGTTNIGKGSTMFYGDGGTVNYTGDDIVMTSEGIAGTIAKTGTKMDFGGKNITTGTKSSGFYIKGTGVIDANSVTNLAKLNVISDSTGIYVANSVAQKPNLDIELVGNRGVGIFTKTQNSDIENLGNITSTLADNKGMIGTEKGNMKNSGTIKLTGDASIGMYGEKITLTNSKDIEVGDGGVIGTTTLSLGANNISSAVGMYGKDEAIVNNEDKIKVGTDAVGIYGENSAVNNKVNGKIEAIKDNSTGIYAVGGIVTNAGSIIMKDDSNGIYTKDGSIINNGNVEVGTNKSSAIYGEGTSSKVTHNGNIKGGEGIVGIATDKGEITINNGATFDMGTHSTYAYADAEEGKISNNANIELSDYSVGLYTKSGDATNENGATIELGNSRVIPQEDPEISVAMATETGAITNKGTIDIQPHNKAGVKPTENNNYGVGMVVNDGGKAINEGTINVKRDKAYGMQATKEDVDGNVHSTLINKGTINVDGYKARGMAATNDSRVVNDTGAVINVRGENAQGIYVDSKSEATNKGTINVNGNGRVGIYVGAGGVITNKGTINTTSNGLATLEGAGSLENVGAINIKGKDVKINDIKLTNVGTITVEGELDFGRIEIAGVDGHIGTISADKFNKGEFVALPNITQGNNKEQYVIQYLDGVRNVPNDGEFSVISQSVSFLAVLQKNEIDPTLDPGEVTEAKNALIAAGNDRSKLTDEERDILDRANPELMRLVMVKVPYEQLFLNTPAVELGIGADDIYAGAQGTEQEMFDAIDNISNKKELAATFDNEIRGNIYANIQTRMEDMNDLFDTSYDNLKDNEIYKRDRVKVGAIIAGGETNSKVAGVLDYDTTTQGAIVIKESDTFTFGRSFDYSLGFTQTKFDFEKDKHQFGFEPGKETAYSLNAGIGFENVFESNKNLKYQGRAALTVNRHKTERNINLSSGTYKNVGKFYSGEINLRNKVRYEVPLVTDRINTGIFGTFDLGYGKFENFKETGDGLRLDLEARDFYSIRPGVGGDVTFKTYAADGVLSLTGKASAQYEFGKIYNGENRAKIRDTNSKYYKLEKPEKIKDILEVGAELKFQTKEGHSIGIGVTRQEGKVDSTKYNASFIYRF